MKDELREKLTDGRTVTDSLQRRRCGKPKCTTCNRGEGHGPYWYVYYREGGKLVSGYVGKDLPDWEALRKERREKERKEEASGKGAPLPQGVRYDV